MKKTLLTLFFACFICTSFAQHPDTLTTTSGVKYFFTYKGNGPALTPGWLAIWNYYLTLADGTKIDATSDRGAPFASQYPSVHLIKGMNEILSLMHIGDKGTFILPYNLAYGVKGTGPIPPKATLVFEMELLDMKPKSLAMVLDSVLYPKPVSDTVKPRMDEALKTFKALKKKKFENVYVSEEDLNTIGYGMIKKYPDDAVALFKLNVKMYPKSFNVYDSLAEGYMDIGNNKLAIKNYEKSLKINPKNTNATEMLKKINGGEAKQ